MGREAIAIACWQGATGDVKALLESQELILRGAIKLRIPRQSIANVVVIGPVLTLLANGENLSLELGDSEAAKWQAALLKPLPSLAEKLGLGPDKPALVLGRCDSPELAEALAHATCKTPEEASLILAILETDADLESAYAMASAHPRLSLWCVYPKGQGAAVGDSRVREFLRERGYRDNKSSAVSAVLTATRYTRAKGSA